MKQLHKSTKKRSTPSRRLALVVTVSLFALASVTARVEAAPQDLRLSAEQAVAKALKLNLGLQLERLSTALSDAPEKAANAGFEPQLFAEINVARSPGSVSSQRAGLSPVSTTSVGGSAGVRKTFSTGTSLELSLSSRALTGGGSLDPAYQSSAALTARQSLLSGISRSANEIAITEARLGKSAAKRELARKAELVARDTLAAYFDLHSALSQDAVAALAVKTAERSLADTNTLIEAGKIAGSEALSARYALQQQQRTRLKTQQAVADARDRLARLCGLVGPTSLATPAIVTVDTRAIVPAASERKTLQAQAFRHRGDLLAAKTQIALAEAKTKAAKHQTLPKLDLVGSVFVNGLSGTTSGTSGTSGASLPEGYFSSYKMDRVGWSVGLLLEVPLGNKRANAALQSAELALRRARLATAIAQQSISQELNLTWRAVALAKDQLALAKSAEQVAAAKLKAEQARYAAGKTTAHILAAVQDELTKEKLGRARAEADLKKALAALHASSGTLLERMRLTI